MPIQRIPMWKEMENWPARQEAMRSYMDSLSEMTTSLTSAGSNRSEGLATIVTQAAIKRMQAEAAARMAKTAAENAQAAADDKAIEKITDRMNDFVTNNKVKLTV